MSTISSQSLCLLCNGACVSDHNFLPVLCDESVTSTKKPIAIVLKELLNKNVADGAVICKKCFKSIDELEQLQNKVSLIKSEITSNIRTSVEPIETEEIVEVKPIADAKHENDLPKKILDIPSSDEDTIQVMEKKPNIQTIEDIEMELVKIHGLENEEDEKEISGAEMDVVTTEHDLHEFTTTSSHSGDIIDAATVDQSSDSDYEPPGSSNANIIQAAQEAVKNSIDNVNIKIESGCEDYTNDKPNILKKKFISVGGTNGTEERKIEVVMDLPCVAREGSLYTCLLCQGDETVAGEAKAIIAHLRQEHNTRLYICDVCGQDFRKRNALSAHVDEHVATEEGDFQCEVCNRIFNNLRLFRIHRRMHYPQNKAWTCDQCGKRYSSRNLLEEHVNSHLGVRPYVCNNCGKDFASKYTFKAHEKTHEVRPRPFKCSYCVKSFLSQQNLAQHERTHTGNKEYACHLCGKQFGSAHNLEVHSIVHTGYKPFICGLCGKAFARKAEIRDHERTHTGERPYQCEFCGATFSQRSNLQSHKRATHYDDKRYRCDDCGKGFKRRRLLDYHMKAAHTGERPFKCDVCEATFVYPEHFKKHRRIHTGEKPYLCEVCGKAFNSRDNRNAHRFVHSDKKPYECLVCGAGFMRKPLLYQHMQAQGHLNDTIVVNQPRLTTDDDQLVTVNSAGEMEIVDATQSTESKLYISDQDGTEHIIIDGQQITFTTAGSDDGNEGEIVDEIEQVVGGEGDTEGVEDYEEIISSDALAGSETQIIETPDGPVQLVKVRIPNENGEEEEAWIKIVPE